MASSLGKQRDKKSFSPAEVRNVETHRFYTGTFVRDVAGKLRVATIKLVRERRESRSREDVGTRRSRACIRARRDTYIDKRRTKECRQVGESPVRGWLLRKKFR